MTYFIAIVHEIVDGDEGFKHNDPTGVLGSFYQQVS